MVLQHLRRPLKRPEGGGGRTRNYNGAVFEKGGVNISAAEGELPEYEKDV